MGGEEGESKDKRNANGKSKDGVSGWRRGGWNEGRKRVRRRGGKK